MKSIINEANLKRVHATNAPPKMIYTGIPSMPLYIAILYLNRFNHSPYVTVIMAIKTTKSSRYLKRLINDRINFKNRRNIMI